MGYTTDFTGSFKVDREVDDSTLELLLGLASTRRMARNVGPEFGIEGEFYVKDDPVGVMSYNEPPVTQPGLWCQWLISEDDRRTIAWDGGEKFYHYVGWIEYLIAKVLAPRGYKLSGDVYWLGEDLSDRGTIMVRDNVVKTFDSRIASTLNSLRVSRFT